MPDNVPTAAAATSAAGSSADSWPSEATDLIVRTVDTVRDRTTRPAIVAARAAVFGVFAGFVSLVALVLLAIALVRVITVYLPGDRVWPSYLIVGGVFLLVGLALWTRTRSGSNG